MSTNQVVDDNAGLMDIFLATTIILIELYVKDIKFYPGSELQDFFFGTVLAKEICWLITHTQELYMLNISFGIINF